MKLDLLESNDCRGSNPPETDLDLVQTKWCCMNQDGEMEWFEFWHSNKTLNQD